MSINTDVQLLQKVPLFQDVDPAHLQVMVFSSRHINSGKGEEIFHVDETGSAAYLVLEGRARIISREGEVIAEAGPGAFLGELSMIARKPYTVTAVAMSDIRLLELTNELFLRVCQEFPHVGKAALAYLSKKLDVSLEELRAVQDYFDKAGSFSGL